MEIRLITAALPYVNNVPHIGHLVGSHLPADIFARYNRIKGNITLFIGGTDEHGTPTELEAIKNNTTSEKITDFYYKIHKDIYEWFNISYDNFSRTSKSKTHYKITQEMFLQMFRNGYIIEKEQELPYDPKWDRFLPDRFVIGKCPYCSYDKARGDQCEMCGRLLDPKDLIEPKNAITGEPIIFRKTRHLFLDLSKLENKLMEWLESKKGIFSENTLSIAFGWIKEGLKARSITRDLKWGVPVPYKELWEATIDRIFTKLDFTSKDKFYDSLINALREIGLVVPGEEIAKIKAMVETHWPRIDNILKEYNYFEIYKEKVLYVWFDAPIGYLSFTVEKLPKDIEAKKVENIEILSIEGEIIKIRADNKEFTIYIKNEGDIIKILDFDPKDFSKINKIFAKIAKHFNKKVISEINWELFWRNKNAKIYHFLGKDNIPFHTVFWPGMIIAFNDSKEFKTEIIKGEINLPYKVVGLNYLNYQGRKISKSQKWGVFCDSILETGLEPDYWRFYLSFLIPENKDTDFNWKEFQEIINKELVNNIGNFVHRVLSFCWKNYNGYIDEKPDNNILEIIKKYKKEIENLFEKIELTDALRKILEFSHLGNQIFQERKSWENPENSKGFIKSMLYYVKALAIFLYPYIPNSSLKILSYFGIENVSWNLVDDFSEIRIVKEPKPLFKKIGDEELKKIMEKATSIKEYKIS